MPARGSRYGYYYSRGSEGSWDQLERQFAKEVISGLAYPMGLVELGSHEPLTEPINWESFRLSQLGRAAIHNEAYEAADDRGQIITQPNFQILALGPVPLSQLNFLDQIAERQKVGPAVFEYRLTRDSVYAASKQEIDVAEIEQFLTAHSPHELSQNIRRTLEEWGLEQEQIVFRSGVNLIHFSEPSLAEHLPANEVRQIGETFAITPADQLDATLAALFAANLLPSVVEASPKSAEGTMEIDATGHIRSKQLLPNLYLSGRLTDLATRTETGWQIDQKLVSKKIKSKAEVQEFINALSILSADELPSSLVENIKAWGGYYGKAKISELILIEFRDQDTLQELLTLPILSEALQPF